MSQGTVSFDQDVKPLFTQTDRDHMTFMLDLWSYNDVKQNANEILDSVTNGRMPPPPPRGGGPWPQAKVDILKEWIKGGYQP